MYRRSAILFLLAGVAFAAVNAADRPRVRRVVKDRGKRVIEAPLKHVVARSAPHASNTTKVVSGKAAARFSKDPEKRDIEVPLKRLVATRASAVPKKAATGDPGKTKPSSNFTNPKVAPGKVRWHASFDKAVQAAGKSRKPVLLFQMIGNLDERFS